MKALLPALHSAVIIMTPLLFAATGGLFPALAGMLNIALEGLLLIGAFAAVAAVYYTGSFAAGIIAAMCISVLLSALLAFTTMNLRSNVFITGLAVNLLAAGLTVVLSYYLFNTRGVFVLHDIKNLNQNVYIYASWLLLLVSWVIIYHTPFGYRLRACDKHPDALVSLGIYPDIYRWAAFLVSGFFCGIGGSFLSLNLGAFVPNMTAGKGWIALVVIFLGGRRPLGLIAAAFVFGLAESFSNYAQGLFNIPADFILSMPYLLTLLAMVLVSVWVKRQNRAS
ncbi:MAG: ABC transporter permease [Treponema sp.]|nr:ABC transporter permease [Treponema sp.]